MSAWVVEVNECRVFATRAGSSWWSMYRSRMESRMTDVKVSLGGNLVHVACECESDARWLANSMVADHALPRSAVRARKVLPAKEEAV